MRLCVVRYAHKSAARLYQLLFGVYVMEFLYMHLLGTHYNDEKACIVAHIAACMHLILLYMKPWVPCYKLKIRLLLLRLSCVPRNAIDCLLCCLLHRNGRPWPKWCSG